jgi:putative ABC transport system permease protein
MNFGDTLSLSMRNLRQSRLRTFLTTLGVSIGIASLAGMVSLGVGLQEQIVGRFLQAGVFDTLTVFSRSNFGAFAEFGARGARGGGIRGRRGGGNDNQAPAPKLNDAAVQQIAALENVREVYPELRVPLQIKLGEFEQQVTAAGIPMSSRGQGAFQTLSHGEFFNKESDTTCMLSLDMAKRIDEKNPGGLIGKNLTLSYASSKKSDATADAALGFQVQRRDMECPIIGIVEREAGPAIPLGGGGISGLMIPQGIANTIDAEIVTNAQSFLRDPQEAKTYSSLTVKVNHAQNAQDVEDRIRNLGYSVFSVNDALRNAKNAFIVLDIFLSLIGSIALAVSSLGIVNTMVMSILERTREIGIMKAIGASNSDVRRIFLIEASAIGLLGGLMGIGLGWLVGQIINFGANVYIRSQGGTAGTLFSLPLWLIASAIGFSIVVSLIAGSYPASRAAKLDPIQALRHD